MRFGSATELLSELRMRNVEVTLVGGRLRCTASQGILNEELKTDLKIWKDDLVDLLQEAGTDKSDTQITEDFPNNRPALSFGQRRLWWLDRLDPKNSAYNIAFILRLEGPVDEHALDLALREIVRRHRVLRTAITTVDGVPCPELTSPTAWRLTRLDLSGQPSDLSADALRQAIRSESEQPFDLTSGNLFRATLIHTGGQQYTLVMAVHHIAADGWSLGIIAGEFSALYTACCDQLPAPLPEIVFQYSEYAAWEASAIESEPLKQELDYWKKQLENCVATEIPTDRPRPEGVSHRGRHIWYALPPRLTAAVREVARREGVTLYVILLAAFYILLYRLTGHTDLVIGGVVNGRNHHKWDKSIGLFINLLAFRASLAGNPEIRELLHRVRETTLGGLAHQQVPFDRVVAALQPHRDLNRSPLFQVMFVLQNLPPISLELRELKVQPIAPERESARLDLTVEVSEINGAAVLDLEYNLDLYDESTVRRMARSYERLLEEITADIDRRISDLDGLSSEDRDALVAAGRGRVIPQRGITIHEWIEERAAAAPEATAVVFQNRELTYRDLSVQSNRLARWLQHRGIDRRSLVGIHLDRSERMVVAVLAVLKTGAAYVPLDPRYPADRLSFMIEDAGMAAILTEDARKHGLACDPATRIISLDADRDSIAEQDAGPVDSGGSPGDRAYVIYTSGSTGKPKGVEITHGSVVNFLSSMLEEPGIAAGDCLVSVTTLSFDIAGLEIYLPLVAGATTVIASTTVTADGRALAKLLADSGATIMQATPASWRMLFESGWQGIPGLKVICGGEALPLDLAKRFLAAGVELWNAYGPTETTIWSTLQRVTTIDQAKSIGRPIANTQVWILDEHGQLAPPCAPGELFIGGDGLALGYLNRPELTRERFIAHAVAGRLYRTGDLARWLPDGCLEFLGRADHQVKIRGFRVELGEIEAALESQTEIRHTAVTVHEFGVGDQRLVAYVALRDQARFDPDGIRNRLMRTLPDYMVPSYVSKLDEIPLTPNGKTDRRALPAPAVSDRLTGQGEPRSATEKRLAALWREILGAAVNAREIGVRDNFFELGGHSLLIVRLQSRIRQEFSRELSVAELFDRPTIGAIAGLLDGNSPLPADDPQGAATTVQPPTAIPDIPIVARDGPLPVTSAQLRLWFLDQLSPGSVAYILPMAVRLRGRLDLAIVEKALSEVVRRHEALRTVFVESNGGPSQLIRPPAPVTLDVADLTGFAPGEREERAHQLTAALGGRPFDLSEGPLFRAQVLRLAEEDHVLVLAVHHIVFDAWSADVLWRDFTAIYAASIEGASPRLAGLPIQFADFAVWQKQAIEHGPGESDLAYWKNRLRGNLPPLDLPTDRPRRMLQTRRGASETLSIAPALCERLQHFAQGQGASLFMTLLAAFNGLLHRVSGQDDILVGTPLAGRSRVEIEEVVGFFVKTVVLRTRVSSGMPFAELLKQVRDTVLEAHAHQNTPFEDLVGALAQERDLTRTPLFQVFFNHLNLQFQGTPIPGVLAERFHDFELQPKFDFTVYATELGGRIDLLLLYDADLFDSQRMVALLEQYRGLLEQITDDPAGSIGRYNLGTPSMESAIPDPKAPLDSGWSGSVIDKFVENALSNPDRIAIEERSVQWSYGQLEALTAKLAGWLQDSGVGPGDAVAVYGRRSGQFVAALLGTLRAGAAFCILDPAYPDARLVDCVAAARPKAFLEVGGGGDPRPVLEAAVTETAGPRRLGLPSAPGIFNLAELKSRSLHTGHANPDSSAYLTFTSGTTGRPKCILGTQRPLGHFIDWHVRQFGLSATDRFSMLSGLAHDPLLRDVFTPLSVGATLCIPEGDDILAPGRLAGWIAGRKVTVAHLTPAMGALLSQGGGFEPLQSLPRLRYAFFGGDLLTSRDVTALAAIAPNVACVNFYGATETPQAMAWHRIDAAVLPSADNLTNPAFPIPIGKPIPDVQLLILNGCGNVAAIGELGEIFVRTPYLSQGYLNDERLTKERFPLNPFTKHAGDRLYRTGDLGRYRPDGLVEFAGRADQQIKIRGYRVEPGGIEAALATHASVRGCAVVARADRSGGNQLIACVAVREGHHFSPDRLRTFLKQLLPEYMIPSAFVLVDVLPLTPNAKIDRAALSRLEPGRAGVEREYVPPDDATERTMVRIWKDVLGIGKIGVLDNFFELGGHSLAATRLIGRLRSEFKIDLPLRCVFLEPTIAGLAKYIRYDAATQSYSYIGEAPRWTCLVPAQPRGSRAPLFLVAGYQGPDDTLLVLSRIIPHLGPDQPVYGFKPRWIEGNREDYSTVDDAAQEFLVELRAVQPKGPYLLGGYCVGGVVALEMARKLLQEGEEVRLLALIDTERPTPLRAFLANVRLAWQRGAHILSVLSGIARAGRGSRWRPFSDLIRHKLGGSPRWSAENAASDRFYRSKVGYRRLMYGHAVKPYPGRITSFVNEKQYQIDKNMGWKHIPKGGLIIYRVPGDHITMLTEHGKEFAQLLRACTDGVPTEHGAPAEHTGVGA